MVIETENIIYFNSKIREINHLKNGEKLIISKIAELTIQALAQYEEVWGLSLLLCFAIPIIWFVIWIMLGIWVYKDAESRGMNGALWLILVIVLGIVGLIIYLLVRAGEKGKKEEEGIKRICTKCGRVVKEDVKYCPHCGEELK